MLYLVAKNSSNVPIAHVVCRIITRKVGDGYRVFLQTAEKRVYKQSYLLRTQEKATELLESVLATDSFRLEDFEGGGYRDELKPVAPVDTKKE